MRGLKIIIFLTLCQLSMFASSFLSTTSTKSLSLGTSTRSTCIALDKILLLSTKGASNRSRRVKRSPSGSRTQKRKNPKQREEFVRPKLKSNGYQNVKQQGLLEPSIVFTNNHLLLVNKPPGYHSQPNESPSMGNNAKCMLTKLKSMALGGGSSKDFLLPMHRLDQVRTVAVLMYLVIFGMYGEELQSLIEWIT